jgi:hypothetical protein
VPFFFVLDHDVTKVQDQQHNQLLWRGYLTKINQEYQALDLLEQHWIIDRLDRIAELQKQLNNLFVAGRWPVGLPAVLRGLLRLRQESFHPGQHAGLSVRRP